MAENSLYEESTRAPLILAGAGVPTRGGVCPSPVEFVDIYPTVAELTGMTPPPTLEGVSLRPLLENPAADWDRPAYSQVHFRDVPGRAVRTRRWRYVEWGDNGERGVELYDHATDPAEMNNLAADPAHDVTRERLAAMLRHP